MVGIVIAAIVKLVAMVILLSGQHVPAQKVLIDCEDYEFKTPCFTIDDGHERIVLNYNPYSWVDLT